MSKPASQHANGPLSARSIDRKVVVMAPVKNDGHGPCVVCPVCGSRIGVHINYAFIGDTVVCGGICGTEIEINDMDDDVLDLIDVSDFDRGGYQL